MQEDDEFESWLCIVRPCPHPISSTMLLNEQPLLSRLCLFLLTEIWKNQPGAGEWNVVDIVYDIVWQGKSVLLVPPAPLLAEAILAFNKISLSLSVLKSHQECVRIFYLRLKNSCVFLLICSPARETTRTDGVQGPESLGLYAKEQPLPWRKKG